MTKTKVCPKCENEMIQGNFTGPQVNWENEEDQKFLKEKGRRIIAYVCTKCGYLESYVNPI